MADRKGNAPYLEIVEHDPDALAKRVLPVGNDGSNFVDVKVTTSGEVATRATYDDDDAVSAAVQCTQDASTQVVGAQSNREGGLLLSNPSAAAVYFSVGGAATVNHHPLARNDSIHIMTKKAVNVYQASGGVPTTFYVTILPYLV